MSCGARKLKTKFGIVPEPLNKKLDGSAVTDVTFFCAMFHVLKEKRCVNSSFEIADERTETVCNGLDFGLPEMQGTDGTRVLARFVARLLIT